VDDRNQTSSVQVFKGY